MEDVDEPVMDIDTCDTENPLAVVEYIDDIYEFYKKTEVRFELLVIFLLISKQAQNLNSLLSS